MRNLPQPTTCLDLKVIQKLVRGSHEYMLQVTKDVRHLLKIYSHELQYDIFIIIIIRFIIIIIRYSAFVMLYALLAPLQIKVTLD